jgi:hypothetical protein
MGRRSRTEKDSLGGLEVWAFVIYVYLIKLC